MKILSYIMVDTRVFFLPHLTNHQGFHHPKNSRIHRSMFLEFTFSTISLLQRMYQKLETEEIWFSSANLNEKGFFCLFFFPRDGHWKNSNFFFTSYLAFLLFLLPFSMVLLPFSFDPLFFSSSNPQKTPLRRSPWVYAPVSCTKS